MNKRDVEVQRRLLRRGLEFYVGTINKVHIRLKSGNLFNDPRIYIYIYIYRESSGVVANMLDCDIVVSLNFSCTLT